MLSQPTEKLCEPADGVGSDGGERSPTEDIAVRDLESCEDAAATDPSEESAPHCPACAQAAAAAAAAARAAVHEAFAELRPSLLRSVAGHAGDRSRRRQRKLSGQTVPGGAAAGTAADDGGPKAVSPPPTPPQNPSPPPPPPPPPPGALWDCSRSDRSAVSSRSSRSQASCASVREVETGIAKGLLQQAGLVQPSGLVQRLQSNLHDEVPRRNFASVLPTDGISGDDAGAITADPTTAEQGSSNASPALLLGPAPPSEHSDPDPSEDGHQPMWGQKSSRARVRRMSSAQVLRVRIKELTKEISRAPGEMYVSEGGTETKCSVFEASPRLLFLFGMLPWDAERRPFASAVYQWWVRVMVMLSVATFFVQHWPTSSEISPLIGQRDLHLTEVPLPVGAILVLVPFMMKRRQQELAETLLLLRKLSLERVYSEWLARWERWDVVVFVVIWCAIMASAASQTALDISDPALGWDALRLAVAAVLSGAIVCLAYTLVFIARSLNVMIDAFCCDIANNWQLHEVAHVWNMTQAVLRMASDTIAPAFLVLVVVLVVTVPLQLLDMGILGSRIAPVPMLLPGLLITCAVLYVLLSASMISEKCARVPALVNAITFGAGTDRARQHVVDYVSSSAAGFYVFDVRLMTSTVVKFVYVWCLVAVGLLTRLASHS